MLVSHTRDWPASSGPVLLNTPISVMSTVSPCRYTTPFSVKYRPELGAAGRDGMKRKSHELQQSSHMHALDYEIHAGMCTIYRCFPFCAAKGGVVLGVWGL